MPQLCLQIWFALISHGSIDTIVYASMIFSVLSIIVSLLSLVSQRTIIRNRHYVSIHYDITGNITSSDLKKFTRQSTEIKLQSALLLGVDRNVLEIIRPSIIQSGVRVHINVSVSKTKSIDMNIPKIMDGSQKSGKLAEIVQQAWSLNHAPVISNMNIEQHESEERKQQTVVVQVMSKSEGSKAYDKDVELAKVNNNGNMPNHPIVVEMDITLGADIPPGVARIQNQFGGGMSVNDNIPDLPRSVSSAFGVGEDYNEGYNINNCDAVENNTITTASPPSDASGDDLDDNNIVTTGNQDVDVMDNDKQNDNGDSEITAWMQKIGYPQHAGKLLVNGYYTLSMVRTIDDPQKLIDMGISPTPEVLGVMYFIKDLKHLPLEVLDKSLNNYNKNNSINREKSADSDDSDIFYPDQWVNAKQTSFRGLKDESYDDKNKTAKQEDSDGKNAENNSIKYHINDKKQEIIEKRMNFD